MRQLAPYVNHLENGGTDDDLRRKQKNIEAFSIEKSIKSSHVHERHSFAFNRTKKMISPKSLALVFVTLDVAWGHHDRSRHPNILQHPAAKLSAPQQYITEGPKSWFTASSAAPSLRTQLPEVPSTDMDQVMLQALSNPRLPKGLSRLLFNGNETVRIMDAAAQLKEPRTNGSDEYACINRCGLLEYPAYVPECETVMRMKACAENCQKKADSVLVPYVLELVALNRQYSCNGNTTEKLAVTKELMTNCSVAILTDTPKLVNLSRNFLQCYLDLEEAKDDATACLVLKNCVSGNLAYVEETCELSKPDRQLMEMVTVYGLTFVSDGRLVNTCPALYSTFGINSVNRMTS